MEETKNKTVKKEVKEAKPPGLQNGLRRLWEHLPKGIRILIAAVLVLSVAGWATLMTFERTDEKVLYSTLEEDDAGAIVNYLKSKNVPYRIGDDGRSIYVSSDKVHEIRLELAGEGLPAGSNVGFELFDQQRFGMTEFEEQIALRRALEGELARTISRIESVKTARVHLVLPKKSFLNSKSETARGSVVLELKNGRVLPEETTRAIIHLVSSSVEGLGPEGITIVDTRGRLLSTEYSGGQKKGDLEYKSKFETDLELRLREMLDQIAGPSSSVVRVSASFDITEQERTEELYDPERTAVRSEQRETESIGGTKEISQGIPGTRTNLPGGAPVETMTGGSSTKREKETINYEVDKVIKRIITPAGTLSKLSVAVLLDSVNDGKGNITPRPAEELKKIETAVKGAIGFDEKRGDRVDVQSIPFHIPEAIDAVEQAYRPPWWKEWLPLAIGGAVGLVLIIAMISLTRKRKGESIEVESLPLPRKVHELETMIQQPALLKAQAKEQAQMPQLAASVGEVQQFFMNDSESASKVIRSWLKEGQ